MLNAKIKRAFKGFKILNKNVVEGSVGYQLMDCNDHMVYIKVNTPGNDNIIDFIESLGYWPWSK